MLTSTRSIALRQWIFLCLFFICNTCFAISANTSDIKAEGYGFVEQVQYIPDKHQLSLSGWASPARVSVFMTNLIVYLGETQVYRGRMEGVTRPDVVENGGANGWFASGFRLTIDLPRSVSNGNMPLRVFVRQGDGHEFLLKAMPTASSVVVASSLKPSLNIGYALLIAIALPLFAFGLSFAHNLNRFLQSAKGPRWFGYSLVASFVILVGTGSTGSSLKIGLDASPFIQHDSEKWFGELRHSRADEWQAFTPMALSQVTHTPPFPVLNRLIGEDGQNMLIVGMTGVPVAHISALAKPATWGFFVLDLRRALAWYWWVPFFFCFASLLAMLVRIHRMDWRLGAVLSLSFTAAPYSVAFSGWPAYASAFPILAILLIDYALHTKHVIRGSLLGTLIGLCTVGFALVLYPSWQISITYLLLPYAIAVFFTRQSSIHWKPPQAVALVFATVVCGGLMFAWWTSAHDAIFALRDSIYPGQRSAETGGDIDRWFLIKGLLSVFTMYNTTSMMGECDAASYVLFLVPAMIGLMLKDIQFRRIDPIDFALLGSVSLILYFMYLGFSPLVARLSFWSSATSYRMDLALGLAQILIIARLLATHQISSQDNRPLQLTVLQYLVVVLSVITVVLGFQFLPTAISASLTAPVMFLVCSGMATGSFLLLSNRPIGFAFLLGVWTLSASLPFNPVGRAPTKLGNSLVDSLRASTSDDFLRVVVLGAQTTWSQSLVATGVPVVNAVLYHPQKTLWNRLDPEGLQSEVYNRYQNLVVTQQSLPKQLAFKIQSPRLDAVALTIDPALANFKILGATHVLAPSSDKPSLDRTNNLLTLKSGNTWELFQVRP